MTHQVARTGAKGKYNAGTVAVIIEALELGMTQRAACNVANIDPATFYDWLNKHDDFSNAVNAARDKGKRDALLAIREAGKDPKHWAANAWYLERSFPEEYRQRVEHIDRPALAEEIMTLAEMLGLGPDVSVERVTAEYLRITGAK